MKFLNRTRCLLFGHVVENWLDPCDRCGARGFDAYEWPGAYWIARRYLFGWLETCPFCRKRGYECKCAEDWEGSSSG